MKKIAQILFVAALSGCGLANSLKANAIYLQTASPVIQGEVVSPLAFSKAWELQSYSETLSVVVTPGPSGSRQISAPNFTDVAVGKLVDLASTTLLLDTASGQTIGSVTISFVNDAGTVYYKVVLSNVIFTSVTQGAGQGTAVSESLNMSFNKVQWTYQPTDSTGAPTGKATSASYDLTAH